MADENTTGKGPDARSFEERVFARFDAMDARFDAMDARFDAVETRLTTLEEKVDARLRETRPIWEGVQTELRRINSKLDQVIADLFETRANQTALDKRVTHLEGTR
ncbi:MAG: hypothetical protein ACRD68_07685 [Pyrinomonadaceae bacterium]